MAAQIPEMLLFDGDPLPLCTKPLEPWLLARGLDLSSPIASPACLRGYLGTWELQRGRLLLVELQSPESGAPLMRRRPPRTLSLDRLFPCHDGPVWAQWFTGRLRCPMGLPLSLDDSIDETIYERDMLVDVEAGRVQRIAFRHNEAEPLHTLVDEMKGLGGPLAPSALAAARAAMRFAANLRQ